MIYLFILLIVILIIVTPLKIIIEAKHVNEDDYIYIKFYIFIFRIFKLKINYRLVLDKIISVFHNKNEKKQRSDSSFIGKIFGFNMQRFNKAGNYILKKIYMKKFILDMNIGFEDAALTAIITGALTGFLNSLLAALSYKINMYEMPSINIKPTFNESAFHFNILSIFSINLGNIIIGGIKFFLGGM